MRFFRFFLTTVPVACFCSLAAYADESIAEGDSLAQTEACKSELSICSDENCDDEGANETEDIISREISSSNREDVYVLSSRMYAEGFASMAFGKTIGVETSYASLGLFLANLCDDTLTFLDARWHHLCDGENGANGGLGIRFGDSGKGCGANIYYDWRRFKSKDFQQVSAGFEGWMSCWEFHLNVSFPLETLSELNTSTIDYPGGYQFTSTETAYTCKVASLLIGRQLDLSNSWTPSLKCVASAGPYWISHKNSENCYGGVASIDLSLYDMLSIKAVYTHDRIFNNRLEAILTVNIPFGRFEESLYGCFSSAFNRRPERFELIPLDRQTHCSYNWSTQ